MPKRAEDANWVKSFRQGLKATCPVGWMVMNDRGKIRLQVGKKPNIKSISLPYYWEESDWISALKRIETAATIYLEHHQKIDLRTAFQIAASASSQVELDWEEAINDFRKFKTRVKDSTWKIKYKPVLDRAIAALNSGKRSSNGPNLCEIALDQWGKGTAQRRHMRLALYSFLNFCVQRRDFPSSWLPPAMSDDEVVVKSKRIGYPLTDSQIIRLVEGIPKTDSGNKWKFAIQLMAVYGLRPQDLREIHAKHNGKELWTDYRKSKGGRKGETTEPRQLFPIWVLDIDGTPVDWNFTLKARVAANESLPPLGKEGKAGEAIGTYLKRQEIWKTLRSEAAKEKEELTPYSFRHRYAYYGHNRPQLDGSYRAPKQIADAMGHTLETHLLSYARFKTRDLAESFDQYPVAK